MDKSCREQVTMLNIRRTGLTMIALAKPYWLPLLPNLSIFRVFWVGRYVLQIHEAAVFSSQVHYVATYNIPQKYDR